MGSLEIGLGPLPTSNPQAFAVSRRVGFMKGAKWCEKRSRKKAVCQKNKGPKGNSEELLGTELQESMPAWSDKPEAMLSSRCLCSPTAESFGVSAQIGSGVVRGGPEVRFHKGSTRVPQGSTRVPRGSVRAAGCEH